MNKTAKMVQAEEAVQAVLTEQMGERAKAILNNIDMMVAQKQNREDIEAMLAKEMKDNIVNMIVCLT